MIHPSATQFTEAMTHAGFASCNEDKRYDVPGCSGICTEVETLALLFGFVRSLRPQLVVETGTNAGCAARTILSALTANGEGKLVTCDIDKDIIAQAYQHCDSPERSSRLLHFHSDGMWAVTMFPDADLYWIDSSEASRMVELEHISTHGKQGAVVLVHDTSLYPYLRQAVETFPRHVVLPGPRGLGIVTL